MFFEIEEYSFRSIIKAYHVKLNSRCLQIKYCYAFQSEKIIEPFFD